MQHIQETNLAWSLIEAAKPHLDARQCNHVFISVGAGDSFTAIRILLKLIDTKKIPLPARLVQLCTGWLQAYLLHEDHERLRILIQGLEVAGVNARPRTIVRSLTRARNPAVLAISAEVHHSEGWNSVRAG
jgi:hypothetical protein